MSIRITAIRLSGGDTHAHIVHLWWTNPSDGSTGHHTRAEIVSFLEQGGTAYVGDCQANRVHVGVVVPAQGEKYLRTHADGAWTNNLLALPRR